MLMPLDFLVSRDDLSKHVSVPGVVTIGCLSSPASTSTWPATTACVVHVHGPVAVGQVFDEMVAGRTQPAVGHVLSLGERRPPSAH